MPWYENYPKGKPFYSVTTCSGISIRKHYFAGWLKSVLSVYLIKSSGGVIKYDAKFIDIFPESEYEEAISRITRLRETQLLNKRSDLELQIRRIDDELSKPEEEVIEIIDHEYREELDDSDIDFIKTLGELHLAE